MRCLRKTDLPPPLRPMTTVIEPVGISRSMPRSTGCRPKRLVNPSTLITGSPRVRLRLARPRSQARLACGCGSQGHDHRLASPTAGARKATITPLPYGPDEVVPDQDQHGREHDRLRRRARHALGAVADVEALVSAHPGDDHAEADRLPEAERDVGHVHERLHLSEVRPRWGAQHLDTGHTAVYVAVHVQP